MADGTPQDSPQAQIISWLHQRYDDFVESLLGLFNTNKPNLQACVEKFIDLRQLASISLVLRLVKDETRHSGGDKVKFSNRIYKSFVTAFLQCKAVDDFVKKAFLDEYLNKYYDLQYYFLQNTAYLPMKR